MKRSKPIRRKSKSELRKWTLKADKALQDHYRTLHLKCESCGRPANIVHHVIEKHLSTALRYENSNLVPLCFSCHTSHHLGGDMRIMARVIEKRGVEWLQFLRVASRQSVQMTVALAKEKYAYFKPTE